MNVYTLQLQLAIYICASLPALPALSYPVTLIIGAITLEQHCTDVTSPTLTLPSKVD